MSANSKIKVTKNEFIVLVPIKVNNDFPIDPDKFYLCRFKQGKDFSPNFVDTLKGDRIHEYKQVLVCWYLPIIIELNKLNELLSNVNMVITK